MSYKKYIIVFIITGAIFGTAFYVSNSLNQKRLDQVRDIEDKVSVDILSSETQFNLLAESSCENISEGNTLSSEMNDLGAKLDYTEKQLGSKNEAVINLKRYYSLLEIKDYLLSKKIGEKCNVKPLTILYFYPSGQECKNCEKASITLTYFRENYPTLRVYSFDYGLPLTAVKTLISIHKVENNFPAIVFGNKTFYGLTDIESFEKVIPELKKLREDKIKREQASSTENSTKK